MIINKLIASIRQRRKDKETPVFVIDYCRSGCYLEIYPHMPFPDAFNLIRVRTFNWKLIAV